MKQVIIFHDAFSSPTQSWYQSIQSILPKDYTLITPELPIGAEQGMTFWLKAVEPYIKNFTNDTIIISHGIGSLLAVKVFENLPNPIRAYISVAGCSQKPSHKVFTSIAGTFLGAPLRWSIITQAVKQVIHIWNTKDPYIEPFLSEHFAEQFPGQKIPLQGQNHFNEGQEPDLLNKLDTFFRTIESEDSEKAIIYEKQQEQLRREELMKSIVPGVTTFESAKAQSIAGYQGNVISELLAEARVQDEIKKIQTVGTTKNIFYIIGTFIFFIIGIGLLGYAMIVYLPKQASLIPKSDAIYESSIFQPDRDDILDISNLKNFELLKNFQALKLKPIQHKTIHRLVLVDENQLLNFETFLTSLSVVSPLGFSTKIDDYIYGYYQPENTSEKIPFLIVKFNGYSIMQMLMDTWEPSIITETRTLFQKETPEQALTKPEPTPFHEVLTKNIFMRTSTLSTGETLYYGFLSDKLLLITPSDIVTEPLLRKIIGR